MWHAPVCARCEVTMRCHKNGVVVEDMFGEPPRGYKLQYGDLWRCPLCFAEVVVGFAENVYARHNDEDFEDKLRGVRESTRVIRAFERMEDAQRARAEEVPF